jgi:release factor glutamine methyltransferase
MTAPVTVETLLAEGVQRLRASPAAAGPGASPELDAQLLLAHCVGLSRAQLQSHPETVAAALQAEQYRFLLARRSAGEPLAYLTGSREFWSLPLTVSPDVLVPRPETELLVERALALHPAATGRVAELGTGSGAVALALASERPHWRILATDLSQPALAVASANAARLGLRNVEFRHGAWFEPLARERFDLLVSNPPYIAADDAALRSVALSFEPLQALSPGGDGLAALRTLVRGAPSHLAAQGWLLLEHGATQAAAVRHELVLAGFAHVRSHRDLAAFERMTEGQHGQI